MARQTTTKAQQYDTKAGKPRRRDIFFHAIKTSKLVGALTTDRRVPVVRKIIFYIIILAMLSILLFPDFFDEAILSIILPVAGTVLGIPLDAGFDWLAFALAAVSLLKLFPEEVVREHYSRLFS